MKQIYYRLLSIALFSLCALSGCVTPSANELDESLWTSTPTLTFTPTQTIQWFPATATPQPAYTIAFESTPDLRPGMGDLIFQDFFDTASDWNLARSELGSVALNRQMITLAVSKSKGSLLSLRNAPVLQDFYLSIDTHTSLCKNNDYYGILFRAISAQDYYRFVIACNGLIRLDRVKGGYAVPLVNWSASSQVPPGSPFDLRLGVWAVGREMRFFINDNYQFSVTDAIFPRGRVGVYVRSMEETAVTVSFSNLEVYALNPRQGLEPLSTATPLKKNTLAPKK